MGLKMSCCERPHLEENKDNEIFTEKKVFINSIPGSKLEYEDFVTIEKLLKKNSGNSPHGI